jgi:hypothetical protein
LLWESVKFSKFRHKHNWYTYFFYCLLLFSFLSYLKLSLFIRVLHLADNTSRLFSWRSFRSRERKKNLPEFPFMTSLTGTTATSSFPRLEPRARLICSQEVNAWSCRAAAARAVVLLHLKRTYYVKAGHVFAKYYYVSHGSTTNHFKIYQWLIMQRNYDNMDESRLMLSVWNLQT